MVEHHVLWKSRSSDEFISWTDSILWALQHAISKKSLGETDVQICVLDTSKIETSSFFAVSDLLRIYKLADEGKLAQRYNFAEYLYHGGLFVHGSSSTVSLNLLRECGLFHLLPETNDPNWRSLLCNAVDPKWKSLLRDEADPFRGNMFSVTRPIEPIEGRTALQLASLFEKQFTMPVMVALLSLRLRDPDDTVFLRLVADYAGT